MAAPPVSNLEGLIRAEGWKIVAWQNFENPSLGIRLPVVLICKSNENHRPISQQWITKKRYLRVEGWVYNIVALPFNDWGVALMKNVQKDADRMRLKFHATTSLKLLLAKVFLQIKKNLKNFVKVYYLCAPKAKEIFGWITIHLLRLWFRM